MLEYRSDPFGNILNLSKHSFSLNTYKLLYKNLNFVSTPKQCSQKQLDTDTENFFCLLKLRGHFKDASETQNFRSIISTFQSQNQNKMDT